MLSKFHVNPESGNPRRCYAVKKCRFGGESGQENHYETKDLAMKAYENSQSTFDSLRSINSKNSVESSKSVENLKDADTINHLETFSQAVKVVHSATTIDKPHVTLTDEKLSEFDKVFQNEKTASSNAMDELKTPIKMFEDEAIQDLRYEEGRGILNLTIPSEPGLNGDYPIGDITQDFDTALNLIKADPRLAFINGDCADLAWDLYYSYPDHVESVSKIWLKDGSDYMHVIAKLKDGSYIDSLGHWSPSGVIDAWAGIMENDFEMRDYEPANRTPSEPVFESSKIIGKYLEDLNLQKVS